MANQRRWDSHVTHVRTNNRCSSLTSAPHKGAATQYRACAADWWVLSLSMRCPPHQPQGPAVGQASGQSFFVGGDVDAFGSFHHERLSYGCDSNSQTMTDSLAPQVTSGTPFSGKRGNFQIPPSLYIHSLDLWSHWDLSRG